MPQKRHHWLDRRLREIGKSQAELARYTNIPSSRFSEFKKRIWKPDFRQAHDMANFLRWPYELMLAKMMENNSVEKVSINYQILSIRGIAAGGIWGKDTLLPEEQWLIVHVPLNPRYAELPIYGIRVHGDAMDAVFPDATLLECVNYDDLGATPADGEYVLVQRRDGNGTSELTVKHYEVDSEGVAWLVSKSTKPQYQEALRHEPARMTILAKVVGSHIAL